MSAALPRVLVVQRRLTRYRVPFFERLRELMHEQGLQLELACGEPTAAERSKGDEGVLPWAHRLPTVYLAGGRVCWQPFGPLLNGCALAVVTHENKLVYNLWVQYLRRDLRLGLWGHGANLQGDPHSLSERFKRRVLHQADWWFGYTRMSEQLIRQAGFPPDRITVLNNAIDTRALAASLAALPAGAGARFCAQHGLRHGRVGLYLGSLYADKQIEFLCDALLQIRAQVPDFGFIFAGGGALLPRVRQFCETHRWAVALGPVHGEAKAQCLAAASLLLVPAAVGLVAVDSFVAGVPLVTAQASNHGPEVAYLEPGRNAMIEPLDCAAYAKAVAHLLIDVPRLAEFRAACLADAREYSIDNMAQRFVTGVRACLSATRRR